MPIKQSYATNPSHTEKMFCVKCRATVIITAPELVKLKNQRYALRGVCPHDGTMCYKVISESRAKELVPSIK
jgi:hypothetical protein